MTQSNDFQIIIETAVQSIEKTNIARDLQTLLHALDSYVRTEITTDGNVRIMDNAAESKQGFIEKVYAATNYLASKSHYYAVSFTITQLHNSNL